MAAQSSGTTAGAETMNGREDAPILTIVRVADGARDGFPAGCGAGSLSFASRAFRFSRFI